MCNEHIIRFYRSRKERAAFRGKRGEAKHWERRMYQEMAIAAGHKLVNG